MRAALARLEKQLLAAVPTVTALMASNPTEEVYLVVDHYLYTMKLIKEALGEEGI